jgi:hypothetical protein
MSEQSLRMFVGGVDYAVPTDPTCRSLFYRAADLKARLFLIDTATSLLNDGNYIGAQLAYHAEIYLADRIGYEADRLGTLLRELTMHPSASLDGRSEA